MIKKNTPVEDKFLSNTYRQGVAMAFDEMGDLIGEFNPRASAACKHAALAALHNDAKAFLQAQRQFQHEIVRDKT